MSRNAPAIPFFTDAYLADTRHLSLDEHGAYLQLLMFAWRSEDCALPDDDARLSRMLGVTVGRWQKLKPAVMAFWQLADGRYTQQRLSKERAFVEKKRENNSRVAKERWEAQAAEKQRQDECERISERNAPPPPPPKEEEERDEAAPHLPARQPIAEALEAWNEVAAPVGWPVVKRLSEARRSALRGRLRDEGLDGWKAAIARAHASPYLGHDPPSWFTFDWIIKPANILKVIEGNYDRNRTHTPARPNEMDAVMRGLGFER